MLQYSIPEVDFDRLSQLRDIQRVFHKRLEHIMEETLQCDANLKKRY